MTSASSRPPGVLRLAAAVLRRLPRVRGRGRLEVLLHRALGGRGWRDLTRVNGYDMEVVLDDLVDRAVYLNGGHEPTTSAIVRALLQPGDVVFDVGAHAGYFSLLFSRLVGPGGAVHAFEPVPRTAVRLRLNLSLNPALAERIEGHEMALSDREGRVTINVSGATNTGASHVVAPDVDDPHRRAAGVARTIVADCQRGDSIWRDLGRPRVSLVKIDVEGQELHVVRGLREMLAADRCTVLAEVLDRYLRGSGGSREELFALLGELGFVACDYVAREGRLVENPTPRDGEIVAFSKGPR